MEEKAIMVMSPATPPNVATRPEVFSVEAGGPKAMSQAHEHVPTSAHTIDHDSWEQVALLLVTGFNCGYILTFSNLMLVPLGWAWGMACLVFVGAFSLYANHLLAGFHVIDGHRFIRYRDLMGFVFGKKMYYITWVLQFLTLVLGNMGFILLGGRALKAINSEFSSSPLRLQSTLRKPAIKNMRKALYTQFSVGLAFYYGVSIVGYWAYGSSVSEYLPKELSGPMWVKVFINATAFIQSIISQHMFCAPIHEALDTKYSKLDESVHSIDNLKRRFILRALLFGANTFVTALFPFMGDFVNLFGSFTLFPLTFVFPSMIFMKVKAKTARKEEKAWHWANIIFFSLLAAITTAAAIKLIVRNARVYHFFADT
ncbi:proline transporter 1-like isoform X2 [Magnolia sinica]|uniref:proline transporter 1-like isoform X2 n=1 Tax=Magnolia sinica TaxID=86752 RepID=UPI002658A75A|nr:proline transporter 1-like isoform X2 [Magnolia sinica]